MTFSDEPPPRSLYAGIAMDDKLIRQGVKRLLACRAIGFSPVDAFTGEKRLDVYFADDVQKLAAFGADRPPVVLCADLRDRLKQKGAIARPERADDPRA